MISARRAHFANESRVDTSVAFRSSTIRWRLGVANVEFEAAEAGECHAGVFPDVRVVADVAEADRRVRVDSVTGLPGAGQLTGMARMHLEPSDISTSARGLLGAIEHFACTLLSSELRCWLTGKFRL